MSAKPEDCPNYEINKQQCPCPETDCEHHGICCECIRFHWGHKVWPNVSCVG